MNTIQSRIQHKRDTSSNWEQNNPIILAGEIIIVDTNSGERRTKTGDGIKRYNELPFDDEIIRNLVSSKDAETLQSAKQYTDEKIGDVDLANVVTAIGGGSIQPNESIGVGPFVITVDEDTDAQIPKAETYSFVIASTSWEKSGTDYVADKENSFISAEGYAYFLSMNAGYNISEYQFDLIIEEGILHIYCSGKPNKLLRFVLTRVPMDGNSIAIVTIGVMPEEEEKSAFNSGIFSTIISKSIPEGRVVGDVDGDGYVTNEDANLILSYVSGNEVFDETQKECADVNSDGEINSIDNLTIQQIITGSKKLGETSRDITGVWTVNPNYATEDGQFYVDVSDEDVSTNSDFVVVLQGDEAKKVTKVVTSDGSFRVYMTIPPIEPMPYKLVANDLEKQDFVVTFSGSGEGPFTSDKTYAEIAAAIAAGDNVYGKYTDDSQGFTIELTLRRDMVLTTTKTAFGFSTLNLTYGLGRVGFVVADDNSVSGIVRYFLPAEDIYIQPSTDYTKAKVRGISLSNTTPSTIPNGFLVGVYE